MSDKETTPENLTEEQFDALFKLIGPILQLGVLVEDNPVKKSFMEIYLQGLEVFRKEHDFSIGGREKLIEDDELEVTDSDIGAAMMLVGGAVLNMEETVTVLSKTLAVIRILRTRMPMREKE